MSGTRREGERIEFRGDQEADPVVEVEFHDSEAYSREIVVARDGTRWRFGADPPDAVVVSGPAETAPAWAEAALQKLGLSGVRYSGGV